MKSIEKSVVKKFNIRGYRKAQSSYAELSCENKLDNGHNDGQELVDKAESKKKLKKKLQKGRTIVLS